MERKIGEFFEEDGVKIQVIKDELHDNSCEGCFYKYTCLNIIQANCTSLTRKDGNNIKYIAYKKKTK